MIYQTCAATTKFKPAETSQVIFGCGVDAFEKGHQAVDLHHMNWFVWTRPIGLDRGSVADPINYGFQW